GGYGESLLVREAGVDPVGQPDFPESGSFTLKQTTSSDTVSIRVPNEQYLGSIQLFAHETDLGSVIIHPEYIFATLLLNSGIKTSMQEMSEHFLETRSFLFHATEIDKNSESWDLDIDQLDLYVLAGTKRLEEVIRTFQGDAIFGYISSKIMLTGASRKNYTDNRKINEILNMSLSLSSFSASPFSGWFSGKVQYTADINYFYDGNGNRHNLPVRLTFSIPKISCDLSEIDSNVIRTKLFVPFDRINPVFDYDVIHHELDDIWKTWSDFAEEPYLRIKLELGNQNGNTTTVQVWEEQQALELLIPLLYTLYQNAF
ncbi:MAG: hypothetical protein PHO72_01480, partial [Sphaerochaeta sp.]|nr:hypothetical protein [Sphaerochaeta sp.]